jgi:Na+-translocating ferredoxin:NAD+ oxidoreductase RnfD subunit
MNNVYLRSKSSIKNIVLKYILALSPFLIMGFYKNGLKLYMNKLITFPQMFKPILLDILGFIIGYLVNIIYSKYLKKEKLNKNIFNSFYPLYGLLIASLVSINTNIFIFIITTFLTLFISKFINKNKFNIVALNTLLCTLLSRLFGKFTFLNIYEQSNKLTLNSIDYLIGRGSGGVNSTCTILLIFSLIILCSNRYYKKEIPLYSIITFISLILVYSFFTNNIGNYLNIIFSNGILFSFIFVAPDTVSSSYSQRGKLIYSIFIGVLTFGLYLIYPPLSSIGAICIVSIFNELIDKLTCKS